VRVNGVVAEAMERLDSPRSLHKAKVDNSELPVSNRLRQSPWVHPERASYGDSIRRNEEARSIPLRFDSKVSALFAFFSLARRDARS